VLRQGIVDVLGLVSTLSLGVVLDFCLVLCFVFGFLSVCGTGNSSQDICVVREVEEVDDVDEADERLHGVADGVELPDGHSSLFLIVTAE